MSENLSNVTDILSAFLPNRAYRRANQGARCTMCGLGIVAVDLALVEVESADSVGKRVSTRPIHTACTSLLWDEIARLRGLDDGVDDEDWAADPGVADAGDA